MLTAWLGRLRRGFNDIKREVEQELHNDAVMQELKKTQQDLQGEVSEIGQDLRQAADQVNPLEDSDKKTTE